MKIEAGKYYRTRDGQKVGPMKDFCHLDGFRWCTEDFAPPYYTDDGRAQPGTASKGFSEEDLIAEWPNEPTGPVRTRTVTEIVPGVYDRVNVVYPDGTWRGRPVLVALVPHDVPDYAPPFRAAMNAVELRAAAAVFMQLADALSLNAEGGDK